MSAVGFVMLCHTALHRAGEVARYWADRDCPVVIHVDKRTDPAEFEALCTAVEGYANIRFSPRFSCEWGTWSLVRATQIAADVLLREFIGVRHACLTSGACLPLRPAEELRAYLAAHPRTDFIESVTIQDVDWTVGGLADERFDLRFPFTWKRQRWLFDRAVIAQRRLGVKRRLPSGIAPHLGSQWWCLTRQTLSAILQDPRRREFDRFFRHSWIPDESYFQTLARRYATNLESRSLTLSKFDFQGRPHVFYDDHLNLLQRSDRFIARKAWPEANLLYDTFIKHRDATPAPARVAKVDQVFDRARDRRVQGRRGLYMAGRFPRNDIEAGRTAAPYTLCQGFDPLFEGFRGWLGRRSGLAVHGHLFASERVEFADGLESYVGGLTDSAAQRDYNPGQFLANLIWNTRGERQVFQFGPQDRQELVSFMAGDKNASLRVVSGVWAVSLYHSNANFGEIRNEAARLQRIESAFLTAIKSTSANADVQVLTLAEFLRHPMEHLQTLLDDVAGPAAPRLTEVPRMADLTGFAQFVQNLKNQGMNPYLVGDIAEEPTSARRKEGMRPYLVR